MERKNRRARCPLHPVLRVVSFARAHCSNRQRVVHPHIQASKSVARVVSPLLLLLLLLAARWFECPGCPPSRPPAECPSDRNLIMWKSPGFHTPILSLPNARSRELTMRDSSVFSANAQRRLASLWAKDDRDLPLPATSQPPADPRRNIVLVVLKRMKRSSIVDKGGGGVRDGIMRAERERRRAL